MKNNIVRSKLLLMTFGLSLLLSACGGTGGGNSTSLSAPTPSLTIDMKQLQFSWSAVSGADHYRILENPDGASGFSVVSGADNITGTSHNVDIPVHKLDWVAAQYMVEACNTDNSSCTGSSAQTLTPADSIAATGYFKPSNTEVDQFGWSVSLSGDGNTLAVGAILEDSAATGIGGNQADNAMANAGAVYVFTKTGGIWSQQAYLKASNTDADDWFGYALALSDDGNTLAVGVNYEDSAATGINGNQTDNTMVNAGAVYVFTRTAGVWSQQAYIKASNTDGVDWFGVSVALSGNGNTLAVGAAYEDSSAIGIDGNQADNTQFNAGAAYVFTRTAGVWSQQAYVKASNTDGDDGFGISVSLSGDGDTLAVGAMMEDSATTGINGNQADNTMANAGAVYVFTRTANVWSQQAYVKASNTGADDWFGYAVTLSSDGSTLAVGVNYEDSAATGINGNQTDNTKPDAGAVYVFTRTLGTWSQQAYIKASNTDAGDGFGFAVALSGDGNTLAVGAFGETSATTGIGGNQTDNTMVNAGAAYIFTRTAGVWSQQTYVKASNTGTEWWFGYAIAMSDNNDTLAVGALGEASASTGIGGTQTDNSTPYAGAVYLY